jgi:hypothetical protein
MAKTKNSDLIDALHVKGLRKRVARAVTGGSGSVSSSRIVKDLRSAATLIEDRVSGQQAKRKAAGKKAAATRKRKAAKRSASAKKAAKTRAKS